MPSETDPALRKRCVASTGVFGLDPLDYTALHDRTRRNFFSHVHFSGDGTTLLAQTADHCLRTFVLPPQLLDESKQPHRLNEYMVNRSPSPLQSYAMYPNFNLQDMSTTVFLSASTDLPILLKNAVQYETTHATYPWINPKTEAYKVPKSLCWTRDSECFIAGGRDDIGLFNAHRYGEGPFLSTHSRMSAEPSVGYGSKGFVMALSVSDNSVLASGTNERRIGLYDGEGGGQCITAFSVADPIDGEIESSKGGGVTQLAWSPAGTYLLAAERQSDGVHVYDMRNTLRRVAFLKGRKALTPQRMNIDLITAADGTELWAGGTDGCVRMWKNPGTVEGFHGPDEEMKLHDDSVGSAVWHPQGTVLATCAGAHRYPPLSLGVNDSDSESEGHEVLDLERESCLKVWNEMEEDRHVLLKEVRSQR